MFVLFLKPRNSTYFHTSVHLLNTTDLFTQRRAMFSSALAFFLNWDFLVFLFFVFVLQVIPFPVIPVGLITNHKTACECKLKHKIWSVNLWTC